MLKLNYLEDPLGTPCSRKACRENVDLDLHLSASDRGRLVFHILKIDFRKESLLGSPKELQVENSEVEKVLEKIRAHV